jgi:AraC-like DNA-binding protein
MALSYLRSRVQGAESFRGDDDTTEWCVLHERFELVSIHRGRCSAWYRGRMVDAPAGTVSAFEPGNLHKNPRNKTTFRVVILDPALASSLLPASLPVEKLHFAPVCVGVPEEILAMHLQTHRLFDEDAEPLELERALVRLLAKTIEVIGERPLASHLARSGRDDVRARRVRDRLDAEFREQVSLGDLARDTNSDKLHVLRSFKRLFGVPPHQYVIQKRISLARRLLSRGERAASVAQQVGFFDQSHLNRHFQRIVGVTPGRYAATMASHARYLR